MAIYYVSQSTQNGYVVGADANNGTAKATPKLTLEGAIAAASTGDTITINSGVYTHATFFDFGAKALTLVEEVAGTVELRATTVTAGTGVVKLATPAAGATVIPALRINARGLQDYCIVLPVDALAISSLTLTGTVLKDPLVRAVNDGKSNHTVTMTAVVLYALSLTDHTKIHRLYYPASHLTGTVSITSTLLSGEVLNRSVTAVLSSGTNITSCL